MRGKRWLRKGERRFGRPRPMPRAAGLLRPGRRDVFAGHRAL